MLRRTLKDKIRFLVLNSKAVFKYLVLAILCEPVELQAKNENRLNGFPLTKTWIFYWIEKRTVLNRFCFGQNLKVNCRVPVKKNSRWFSFSFFLFRLVFSSEHSVITTWQFCVFRYVCSSLQSAPVSLNASSLTRKKKLENINDPAKSLGVKRPSLARLLRPCFRRLFFSPLYFRVTLELNEKGTAPSLCSLGH